MDERQESEFLSGKRHKIKHPALQNDPHQQIIFFSYLRKRTANQDNSCFSGRFQPDYPVKTSAFLPGSGNR
jgi:hypothetical protein